MPNFKKSGLLLFAGLTFLALGFGRIALAEDVILNDLAGGQVNFSSYDLKKPAILFFWTTWCPYCREEIRKLNLQSPQIAKDGVALLGINVGEADYKVRRFFNDYALNFKMLLDRYMLLADKYDVIGVPTYILLDKAGKVVSRYQSLPKDYRGLFKPKLKNE
jgi:peroxiredoxin